MKAFLHQVKRLCYRLVCWINYPTSRERMWHMYACGKVQGAKEALARLPITQVQPAVPKIKPLNLPPGVLTRQWLDEHRAAIPSQPAYWPAPFEEHAWLNSKPPIEVSRMTPAEIEKVPTIRDLTPDITEEMPAVVKLLHQNREQRRHAG